MYYLIIFTVILLDQILKQLVRVTMDLNQSIPVWNQVFHLTYIQNYGAAFSMLQNQRLLLLATTSILLLGMSGYLVWKYRTLQPWIKLSMSLIIGGGIGNLIDRVLLHYVVDYIDFRVFPVFNAADIAVTVGCGLLILYIMVLEPRAEKRKKIA